MNLFFACMAMMLHDKSILQFFSDECERLDEVFPVWTRIFF